MSLPVLDLEKDRCLSAIGETELYGSLRLGLEKTWHVSRSLGSVALTCGALPDTDHMQRFDLGRHRQSDRLQPVQLTRFDSRAQWPHLTFGPHIVQIQSVPVIGEVELIVSCQDLRRLDQLALTSTPSSIHVPRGRYSLGMKDPFTKPRPFGRGPPGGAAALLLNHADTSSGIDAKDVS